MCIICKKSTANLKLIGNLIVSPDTWTVSMARYADTLDYRISSFWIEATVDFVRAISDGMFSVECRHTNFKWYVQI